MRRMLFALPLVTMVAVVGWASAYTTAQEAKTARGTVKALAADSVTVTVGSQEMKFTVDSKTMVEATGAGTQTRQAVAAGRAGPKLADVVKTGQAVEVSYHEAGGTMHATQIRLIRSTGATGGSVTEAKPAAESSSGTVQTVTATSMTITGSGGSGATFTQTFTIDANTKVIGVGAGTATVASGGRVAITALVGAGDKVSVSSRQVGSTLAATEVRVTTKMAK